MIYASDQKATDLINMYEYISEMLYLLKAFKEFIKTDVPARTTKQSMYSKLRWFEIKMVGRYAHKTNLGEISMLDDNVVDKLMLNAIADMHTITIGKFTDIVYKYLDTADKRVTANVMYKHVESEVYDYVNYHVFSLDTHRGLL